MRPFTSVIGTLFLACVALALPTGGFSETFDLTYGPASLEFDLPTLFCRIQAQSLPSLPSGVKGIDLKTGEKVVYFSIANRQPPVLIAVARGEKLSAVRLLVDTTAQGDFVEQPQVITKATSAELPGGMQIYKFGPFELPGPAAGEGRRPSVVVEMYLLPKQPTPTVLVQSAGYCTGRIRLGDGTFQGAMVDANFSGIFGDKSAGAAPNHREPAPDKIFIDLDQNGQFDARTECFPLVDLLGLNGRYYQFKPSADGATLTVEEKKPACGILDVGNPNVELMARSDTCCSYLTGDRGAFRLPAGRYSISAFQLKTTESGHPQVLSGSRPSAAMANIRITADQTTKLAMGPPLTIQTGAVRQGEVFSINLQILGQAGEEYSPTRTGKAPEFTILDEDGLGLQSGKFEFG